jgi:hypothetical protein
MGPKREVAWWTVVSLALAGLALARMGEVFIKRELGARVSLMQSELDGRNKVWRDSVSRREALRVDLLTAQAQSKVAPDETYLVLKKWAGRGQIMMGTKVVYEFRFRVRGGVPMPVKGQTPELPEGVLEVKGKEERPVWYKPDWLYEQSKQQVPRDSADRMVVDAFGTYAVYLGGGAAIHGVPSPLVSSEVVDHVYAEMNEKDLKAVYNAVQTGSRVLIQR